jgi:apolipoprotein N-acyltransferase
MANLMLFLIALAIGALSAFAFQPVGATPLAPLALAALCELIWRAKSLRQGLAIGWAFGLGQFIVGLNWIATAFTYQAAMPAWLGWVAVVLLSLYLAMYPALAAGLAWRFKQQPIALVLTLAGAWALTEWLRASMFTGFPWNPLAAADLGAASHLVPLVGTYGAGLFLVLIAGSLWLLRFREIRPLLACLAVGVGGTLLTNALYRPVPVPENREVRVVQPNIGQEDKWRPGFDEQAARQLASLSMAPVGRHPRLLLWPEAAVVNPLEDQRTDANGAYARFERQRSAAVVEPGGLLLTGGLAIFSRDGRRIDGASNSVFVVGHGGRQIARYDKAHLVPYGEYLPMRPLLSAIGLSRLAPGDIDFNPGLGPRTLALPGWGKVGYQICYEIVFSGSVVDRANRPDFIFNPSNDAWFGRWGPPQHLAQARLRAAEEGLPVIRATPTGISAIIDARGNVMQSIPWQRPGVIDSVIPAASTPTLFARLGNVIALLLAFVLLGAGIVLGRARR